MPRPACPPRRGRRGSGGRLSDPCGGRLAARGGAGIATFIGGTISLIAGAALATHVFAIDWVDLLTIPLRRRAARAQGDVDEEDEEQEEAPVTLRKSRPSKVADLPFEPDAATTTAPTIAQRRPPEISDPARAVKQAEFSSLSKQTDMFDSVTLPALDLLSDPPADAGPPIDKLVLERNARLLETVLDDFNVKGEVTGVRTGPVVTSYELEPAPGIKASRVIGLADDVARNMSAISARVSPIPGRTVMAIELPNAVRQMVSFKEMIASETFVAHKGQLPIILGKDIAGEPIVADLATMPHLLVAGTTGSGKSVGLNCILLSLLYRLTPAQCRMILVDPKVLELKSYEDIPPAIPRGDRARQGGARAEMGGGGDGAPLSPDERDQRAQHRQLQREGEEQRRQGQAAGPPHLDRLRPRHGRGIVRGQAARLSGAAADRGDRRRIGRLDGHRRQGSRSADPASGAEIACRRYPPHHGDAAAIGRRHHRRHQGEPAHAYLLCRDQPHRSRTILGEQGAEQLLGKGDMLFKPSSGPIVRVHGPFVPDEEVEAVADHWRAQGKPDYVDSVTEEPAEGSYGFEDLDATASDNPEERKYRQACQIVFESQKASTSWLQRQMTVGYNTAAKWIERMEEDGFVGPANHVGRREIYRDKDGNPL
jgi:S-DNA-T family DNA segregation ATPase FtsK/SpoIIIE